MQLMLSQDEPADYVIGTGETHTGQELVECAFRAAGLDWRDHVVTDAAFIRPAEVDQLRADAARARDQLGWEPKIAFEELVTMMVDADLELLASTNGNFGDVFGPDTW
jgi:GDPmannose 4,6-dehydratase